jgi:D-alanyl-D-alanine carboxypeptidase
MKVGKTSTHPRRRRTIIVCTVLTLLVTVGLGVYFAITQVQITNLQHKVDALTRSANARIAKIEAIKKQPVYITLPGADKIQVPVDDFEAASSIWTLVNKGRGLPIDYIPTDLVVAEQPTRANATSDEKRLRAVTSEALKKLFAAASVNSHSLMIGSAYRSAATQDSLFNRYVATSGYDQADRYSAHPGFSEHQTGLAVDISTTSQQCYLSECFINTADGSWLADNAYKYGFNLRYAKGKETITGYNFEPWHYRYVGIPLATALYQSGLTLDEAWPYMETALQTLRQHRAI